MTMPAGRPWLPQAGVYDNRARAYNPGLGRFMQPDPIGQRGGLNIYNYTGGDPVNFTDPSGLYSNGCFHHDRNVCAAGGYLEPSAYWPSQSNGGFRPNLMTMSLYGSIAGMGWANIASFFDGLTHEQSRMMMQIINASNACGGVDALIAAWITNDDPAASGTMGSFSGSGMRYGIMSSWIGRPSFGTILVDTGGRSFEHNFRSDPYGGNEVYTDDSAGFAELGPDLSISSQAGTGTFAFSSVFLGAVSTGGGCMS